MADVELDWVWRSLLLRHFKKLQLGATLMRYSTLCSIGTLTCFITLATVSQVLVAQSSNKKPGTTPPTPHGTSHLMITPAPGQVPRTMNELCALSSLIVLAAVTK